MKRFITLLCLCFFFSQTILAQSTSPKTSPTRFFKLYFDNDLFYHTDRYYTQGTIYQLTAPKIQRSPFTKLLPGLKGSTNYYSLAWIHNGYTPIQIKEERVIYNDRPYASYMYLEHNRISTDPQRKIRLSSGWGLGVIGPIALGGEIQTAIHTIFVSPIPQGWEHQIRNDFVLTYDLKFEQNLFERKRINMTAYPYTTLGTLLNRLGLGSQIRIGRINPYFQNLGIAAPNTPEAQNTHKFQCYFSAKAEVEGIAYDATLQGGILNRTSIHSLYNSQINRLRIRTHTGIFFAFRRMQWNYTHVWQSQTFSIGKWHHWGNISLLIPTLAKNCYYC